ncbi:MAG: hypoxanthine-guanine phosphoribosyltransferase [Xanthomonadales bacterium]|nr:hypoxanthine-guanine phosphoribosyltransferase [Xanthomonadales bacterium]
MSNPPDPRTLLENSRVLFNREEVAAAVQKMADEINEYYGDQPIILISVLTGAIIPAAWLITKLKMPIQMDFVHATRYRGGLYGAELEYRVPPRLDLEGKHVLIVDDIFDEGNTLAAIKGSVEKRLAGSVKMASLVRKDHDRGLPRDYVDFIGLDVPDVYVFGCGMDAYEEWRHLDEILVLE